MTSPQGHDLRASDLELLIELNLHEDHRPRWTRMTKYFYYFDILNLIVAFGHNELWLRPCLKSDWPNRLSKATTYWRRGILKFETFLNGYFSIWIPKKVGNASIFLFFDFDHFFSRTLIHIIYLISVRGNFDMSCEDVGAPSQLTQPFHGYFSKWVLKKSSLAFNFLDFGWAGSYE